jgi:RimJ/RimL family protein N-acetyltransferase
MGSEEDTVTLELTGGLKAAETPISAGRLVLRRVRRSDAGLFALYAGDRRVAEATPSIPHPLPPGAAEAFVARAMPGKGEEDVWIIDGSPAGLPEMLGAIGLKTMDRGQSEVAFWVAPAFWNIGIASEALAALIAANPEGNTTLFAEAFQDNPGSARVLTNNGFAYIGDAESFSVARNARVPTWTYVRKLG